MCEICESNHNKESTQCPSTIIHTRYCRQYEAQKSDQQHITHRMNVKYLIYDLVAYIKSVVACLSVTLEAKELQVNSSELIVSGIVRNSHPHAKQRSE